MEDKQILKFLVDASFLISLIDEDDSNHARAKKISINIDKNINLAITNYNYLEVATVLSQRKGSQINLLAELNKINLKIVYIPNEIFVKAIEQYPKKSLKNISFIDLMVSIYISIFKYNGIVTFDKHFKTLSDDFDFKILN